MCQAPWVALSFLYPLFSSNRVNVGLGGNVCVPVEDKTGAVGVGSHVIPEQPVSDVHPGDVGVALVADLVQAIAGGSEDLGWDQGLAFRELLKELRLRDCVVIDHMVE